MSRIPKSFALNLNLEFLVSPSDKRVGRGGGGSSLKIYNFIDLN